MFPQHVAANIPPALGFEALESHCTHAAVSGYPLARLSCKHSLRFTQVNLTSSKGQARSDSQVSPKETIRRKRCPRASRSSPWQAFWQPLQPARSRKKSLSWSRPNPFRSSPPLPANTSNQGAGRADAPASPFLPTAPGSGVRAC